MKAVNHLLMLFFLPIFLLGQDTLIYKSTSLDFDSMMVMLDAYNFEDENPTIVSHQKLSPFKAKFYKSYRSGWVLVEIDSSVEFGSVGLHSKSFSLVTNIRRFVIPADIYELRVEFERCKYIKVGVNVSDCKLDIKYHVNPPSSPNEDNGSIEILKCNQDYIWDNQGSYDSILYNVHTGYYNLNLSTYFGCEQTITLPVIYQGGDIQDLPNFDQSIVVHTKG